MRVHNNNYPKCWGKPYVCPYLIAFRQTIAFQKRHWFLRNLSKPTCLWPQLDGINLDSVYFQQVDPYEHKQRTNALVWEGDQNWQPRSCDLEISSFGAARKESELFRLKIKFFLFCKRGWGGHLSDIAFHYNRHSSIFVMKQTSSKRGSFSEYQNKSSY